MFSCFLDIELLSGGRRFHENVRSVYLSIVIITGNLFGNYMCSSIYLVFNY